MIGTSRRAFWFRRSWPFLAVGAAVVLGAVGLLWASGLKAGVSSIPTPTLAALGPTTSASPVATPTPSPTPSPLPTPTPS
ncbi:MAG: hypothetical protein ACXWN2_10830, partial [Candidatus Limnocylindrales bacterium]